jgi:Na+/H+ antiporter NhaD/arsenite permease-like protein
MTFPAILSTTIFVVCLILIFTDKLNRTIAAVAGAALMVIAGLVLNFYTEDQAIATIDFHTLGLLLGMMLLVSLLEPTGFFQFLAIWVARLSKGRPVRLLVLLGTVTTVISMFLDNVTTIVLIAPVTILICEILGINPQPLLMAEALLSDTGGVATLVGDPPNVLIASAAGLTFNDFLTHSLPIVVIVWLAALLLLRFLFRKDLAEMPANRNAILSLDPNEVLTDRKGAFKVIIVVFAAVILFLLEEKLHVRTSLIALSCAAAGFLWLRPNIRETLKRIEWDVLMFFGALFVMVGGLEQAGVLHALSEAISQAKVLPPVVLGILLIWIVAIMSAIIDNIPITIALIPVVMDLGMAGINPMPLWWALAFGAGFGGNGTIIGSTANVVVASLSERTRYPITSKVWNKRGLPVMLVTCSVASVLYVLFYPLLSR